MATTYETLANITLGSAQSTVTFSSISQNYTDLVLVITGTTVGDSYIGLQFNSDTGTNYSMTRIYGSGSAASTSRNSGNTYIQMSTGSSVTNVPNYIVNIMNYSNSSVNKTTINRSNTDYTAIHLGLWRNTAAITSVTVRGIDYNLNTGQTFALYGIKAA